MSRLHPADYRERVLGRAKERNERIRHVLATPGFGFVVILTDRVGARFMRFGRTYAEAKARRDDEMATGRYEKAWLIQRSWDAAMSITSDPTARSRRPWSDDDLVSLAPRG